MFYSVELELDSDNTKSFNTSVKLKKLLLHISCTCFLCYWIFLISFFLTISAQASLLLQHPLFFFLTHLFWNLLLLPLYLISKYHVYVNDSLIFISGSHSWAPDPCFHIIYASPRALQTEQIQNRKKLFFCPNSPFVASILSITCLSFQSLRLGNIQVVLASLFL